MLPRFLLAFALLHGLWTIFHWGGAALAARIAGLPLAISSTLATVAVLGRISSEPHPGLRRGWTTLAVALGLYSVASAIWGYYTVAYPAIPFPSIAEPLFLIFPWLVFLALTQLTGRQHSAVVQARIRLNTLIVVFSLGLIEWVWLLRASVEQADSLLAIVAAVMYPLGDLVMLGGVAFTLQHAWKAERRTFLLPLLSGVLLFVIGNVIYAAQITVRTYFTGTLLDICWTLGLAAFALAATRPLPVDDLAPVKSGAEQSSSALILGLQLGGFLSLLPLMTQAGTLSDAVIAVTLLVGLGLLMFRRQTLDAQENLELTRHLHSANAQLIERVQSAVGALEGRNAELTRQSQQLAQRNVEIQTFGDLADLLQACLTLEEVREVLLKAVRQLFPETWGAVNVFNASRNRLEPFVSWGQQPGGDHTETFAPSDCWALRRGRPHVLHEEGARLSMACAQLQEAAQGAYLCLPLVAPGETVGVLRLMALPGASPDTGALQARAQNLARQVALALANLRLREALRSQAIRDPLTGLHNRRYLQETLEQGVHRAGRMHTPVTVLMVDVDHFKTFNDTFGHDAGDYVLQELGRVMQQTFRDEDVVCRYGGEEFTVVLLDTGEADAVMRAESLREAVQGLPLMFRGQTLGGVTVSVGVAAWGGSHESPEALLRQADQALFQAKRQGRNRVCRAEGSAASLA